jgi:hypothetical protein
MTQLQGVMIMLVLLALALAPAIWQKARERDARSKEMTGAEVVAYLMYAEHCDGDRASLEQYEQSPYLQATWLGMAQRRMARWRAAQ